MGYPAETTWEEIRLHKESHKIPHGLDQNSDASKKHILPFIIRNLIVIVNKTQFFSIIVRRLRNLLPRCSKNGFKTINATGGGSIFERE